ncbi:MFS transporter [Temperatibacter marinus]|uniref:MFS transporter n=1 Tax=Temperatibacter marinus TaxID=1456591 RepID=A0AA52EAC6_9PROT|nr:MFS transporter [Temperatibacter marinus]WND01637.1 MFS transporter [Temperatibacter marinus]
MSEHTDLNVAAAQANKKGRNYVLFILFLAYTFNFIDRQILVILQEGIKADLGLSDTQLGILTGFSFAIFYVTAGIPIASWADKANRTKIISGAVAIWSLMTAASGLVTNYTQLVLARIGVGIGEAGCSPPAHSMISDMYERKERATALSIYSTGIYLGIFVGFLIGGYVQEYYGWRMTFLIVGIPGVLLALVMYLTVREPLRRRHAGEEVESEKPSMIATMKLIWAKKSFRYLSLGCAMAGFVAYGTGNFTPSYLARSHGMSPSEIGLSLALITGIGGMSGTFLGGYLTDKFGVKDKRWYLWIPALGGLICLPLYIMAYMANDASLVIWTLPFAILVSTTYLGPSIACSHMIVSPSQRAMASALLFFILNLIGLGLGPLFIGIVSDLLTERYEEEALRYALLIGLSFILVKIWMFLKGAKHLANDIKEAQS